MTGLSEELLLVSLSPDEGRNLIGHEGIRPALCTAAVLDGWAAGAPLPPLKELRKHVRKHSFESLDPALARFAASGSTTRTRRLASQFEWLTDAVSRTAVRDRLAASLSGSSVPARHDAALAVLLYCGSLWDWAFDVPSEKPQRSRLTRIWPGPLAARAEMLASGKAVPNGAAATDLPTIARVLRREVRDHGDDIRGG